MPARHKTRFTYAMNVMPDYIINGSIEARKASEIFGKGAFYEDEVFGLITYQFDPLTGKDMCFFYDQHYFFMLDDSMEGRISHYEKELNSSRVRVMK